MGFRYALRLKDGSDAGEAEYATHPQPGDEIYIAGAKRVRVLSVVPHERISEWIDAPVYGILEVEPA